MKNTLFTKFLGTYLILIIITLMIIGILQITLYRDYLVDSKENELLMKSKALAEIVKPLLIKGIDPHEVLNSINRVDLVLGTEAWVIDKEGKVIAASAQHLYCEGNTLVESDLQQLRMNQPSVRSGQSQFFTEPVIRTATPIFEGDKFFGAIIYYTPVRGVETFLSNTKNMFIASGLLAAFCSLFIGFWLSRYLTIPLRELNTAVETLGEGRLARRVTIKSNDELGNLGRAFNEMTRRLESFERLRREFVSNVAHELRSPLTSIVGFVDALIDDKGDTQDKKRYLEIIQVQTLRLSKLVNDLLDISRFDAKATRLNKEEFAIKAVINRAIASLRPQLKFKEINVEVFADDIACFGDEDRIEQVIHNYLDNAIRYSPTKGKITLSVFSEDDKIILEVADDGLGIADEELHRVWERFYRVEKARSRNEGGTGLGLAIAKEIINAHGGEVTVRSQLGKGSVFGFSIPI